MGDDLLREFLAERMIVSGSELDFMPAGDLISAFWSWQDEKGHMRWGARTVSLRLVALAGKWCCPRTRKAYIRSKNGVTGYRGIRPLHSCAGGGRA